ncbi:hypothetical protein AB0J28_42765 [Streptosporangium canum]|uniref:hypothetical protein n=1 Tax=Streptosporangium canum TaxID=324952 RepID=UPI00342DF262
MTRSLAPLLVRTGLQLPLARRVQSGDADLLRLLTQQTGDRELFARTTPSALCEPAVAAAAEETLVVLRQIQEALLGLIERSQTLNQ